MKKCGQRLRRSGLQRNGKIEVMRRSGLRPDGYGQSADQRKPFDKALGAGLGQSRDYLVEGFVEHALRRSQQVSDNSMAKAKRSPGDNL
jgi:hypothetical protein